jgi:hypothetical protein
VLDEPSGVRGHLTLSRGPLHSEPVSELGLRKRYP